MAATTRRVWTFSAREKRRSEQRFARTVAALFIVSGLAWVLVTDGLLYALARDPVLVARLETAKGWIFVALGTLFIYAVALRGASRLTRAYGLISAVIESIGDGVLLVGSDRTIEHANPAALRMLRCARTEDLVGMDAVEFARRFHVSNLDGSLVPPDRFISLRAFDQGGTLNYKSILHPPGAPELVISATAAAVRQRSDDSTEMVVSVMHDITDSEHLERLRDRFFAAAAHSLKTPVAIIKANVQLMARRAGPELRRSTAAIERQCDRIDRLVQNLLVLARARSGTLKLYPRYVELGPLVERVSRQMAACSPQHDLRTEILASPRVYADEERLALALRNVIDGACRSSAPGSPLTVLLQRNGAEAELGVRYRPLPLEERAFEAHGEYDDVDIGRRVAATVAEAQGGALTEETVGPETTDWIKVLAVEGADERA